MTPFTANISRPVLDDLKNRIIAARWPDELPSTNWEFGAPLQYMKKLTKYWAYEFDWRKTESIINSFPNYICAVDGCAIHFLHIRGKGKKNIPLIMTHGWPGSFLEFIKMIPLLTENKELSFDLVIPSMPGFGFSGKPDKSGCNVWLMAELFAKLISKLGYKKIIAHGGDFGAGVCTAMALQFPELLTAIHLNYIPGSYRPYIQPGTQLTEEEIQFIRGADEWYDREGSYAHQQRTRPLTLGYSLNDSPVGLCAWITEKFYRWADCRGDLENVMSMDELLDNITLYWVTGTIHSSIRLYNENSKRPFHFTKEQFVNIPVGIAHFPFEEPFPPRRYIERGYNVVHWTDMKAGGHFAALEQPDALAADILEFASELV
jgi:pimeloyl-ACP methyl ester carboxylesterase